MCFTLLVANYVLKSDVTQILKCVEIFNTVMNFFISITALNQGYELLLWSIVKLLSISICPHFHDIQPADKEPMIILHIYMKIKERIKK